MPARANELTVYEGTATNDYVPIYGLYVDEFLKCEFIIPASELAEMKDGTITGLTWYLSRTAAASWGNANFQVFIKEVDFTSFSSNAFSGANGATTVYQGSIDGTQSTMNINFTTPYTYGGGNLLVGVYNTAKGTYKSSSFYGQAVNNASINGYNGSSLNNLTQGTRRNFAPKTTFTYEPASAYPKPTNLAVSVITAHSANASWTGNDDAQSYNLRYRKAAYSETFFSDDFENGLGNWTIYTDGEAPQTNGWTITANGSLENVNAHSGNNVASAWSWSGDAYNADNWLVTPQVTFGNNLKFWVRTAGQWPDSYEVLLSISGNAESNFTVTLKAMATAPTNDQWNEVNIDLSAYKGQTGYIAIHHVSYDANYLLIDDFGIYGDDVDAGEWIPISPATIPQDITGLDPETEYEVQVQAVYADGSSDWTNSVNFTTLPADAMPTDLTVTEITDRSATANWNGVQDSYNLRYREAVVLNYISENFGNGMPEGWTTIDNDGDNYGWMPYFADCISSASFINNVGALNPDNWLITPKLNLGGQLSFVAWGQDSNDYSEVFKVYVSTTGTAVADFVEISQDITTTHDQTTYSFDLSQYAGQKGYIAIRHYNCTNMYWLNVTNFVYNNGENIIPNWVTIPNVTSPYTIEGLDPETEYEVQVQGIFGENTTNWTESELFTTLMKRTTLAEIEDEGVNRKYTVVDQLIAIDYRQVGDNDVYLWCKDQGNASINPTFIDEATQIDFMIQDGAQSGAWDQSNWVILKLTGSNGIDLAEAAKGHYIEPGTITGTYDPSNYMINVEGTFEVSDDPAPTYKKNVYSTSNFVESNLGQPGALTGQNEQYYFFMNPKIQEVCHITYAMWDGEKFTVPKNSGFAGELNINMAYNINEAGTPVLEPVLVGETVYEFDAIVTKEMSKAGGYVVYPANLTGDTNIVTAINTVIVNGEVVGVEYVNSLGVVSKTPFQGVNIVVTRYSDGSKTTEKKVFK